MIPEGALPWQPMFDKIGKLTSLFSMLTSQNKFEYHSFDLNDVQI